MNQSPLFHFSIPAVLITAYSLLACWPHYRPAPPYGLYQVYTPWLSAPLAAALFAALLAWGVFLLRKGLRRPQLGLLLLPLAALLVGLSVQNHYSKPRTLEDLVFANYDETMELQTFVLEIDPPQGAKEWYAGDGQRPTAAESAAWDAIKSLAVTPALPRPLRGRLQGQGPYNYVLSPSFRSQTHRSTTPFLDIYWYSDQLICLQFSAFGGKEPPKPTYYYVPGGLPAERIQSLAKSLRPAA